MHGTEMGSPPVPCHCPTPCYCCCPRRCHRCPTPCHCCCPSPCHRCPARVTAESSSRAVTRGPSRAGSGWRLDGRWQHPTDRRTDGPAAVSPREAPQPWQWHRGTEPGLCHPHHTGKLSATTIQTETLKSAFPALGSGIPSSGLSSEPSWPPTGHGL